MDDHFPRLSPTRPTRLISRRGPTNTADCRVAVSWPSLGPGCYPPFCRTGLHSRAFTCSLQTAFSAPQNGTRPGVHLVRKFGKFLCPNQHSSGHLMKSTGPVVWPASGRVDEEEAQQVCVCLYLGLQWGAHLARTPEGPQRVGLEANSCGGFCGFCIGQMGARKTLRTGASLWGGEKHTQTVHTITINHNAGDTATLRPTLTLTRPH